MALHILDEANRCLECKNPTCIKGCPIGTPIPQVIKLLKDNRLDEAGKILFFNNPLTTICSLICNHEKQCEGHCVLAKKGNPVHFSAIESYISNAYAPKMVKGPAVSNGMRVAIVGSGPAGLTIAIILARYGYQVTIFESKDKIGGVLRYGIPEFRLPKSIVKKEVDQLTAMGVKIMTNVIIGKTLTVDQLFEMGYEAVYIGSGAGLPSFMGIPGESLKGVYSANEFLTRSNLMQAYRDDPVTPIMKGGRVAVVGGGNVAMDAARTALRLGAEKVYIVYRRSMEELPARREEVEHAIEEGVEMMLLTNPTEILGYENPDDRRDPCNGFVTGMRCIRMELGEPDERGRRRPVEIADSDFTLNVDTVVMSIGTTPNPLIKSTTAGLEVNSRGGIIVTDTGATSRDGVWAGGDAVTGAATVISAMGAGKLAAKGIAEKLLNA